MEHRQFESMLAVARARLARHAPEDIAEKAGVRYADGAFQIPTLGQTVTVRLPDCTIEPPLSNWHALTLLHLLKKGANQAVDISAAYNSGRVTLAVNRQETFRENAGSASVFLEGISGTVTGRVFPIQEGQVLTIGRLEGCDLCLPGQGNVSGRHCRIAMQAGQLTVTDLGSTNGTYVGGQRLAANVPVALRGGSTVYLGGQDCGLRVRT